MNRNLAVVGALALALIAPGHASAVVAYPPEASLYAGSTTTSVLSDPFYVAPGNTLYDLAFSVGNIKWTNATDGGITFDVVNESGRTRIYSGTFSNGPIDPETSVTLISGFYKLRFNAEALGGGGFTATNLNATISPVPGPIAGAGLPAVVAALGLGLYRRRRASLP